MTNETEDTKGEWRREPERVTTHERAEDVCGDAAVDCEETIERLYFFLDGELTDDRRVLIQRHLDECHHCWEAFDFEAELRQVIASKCRDKVPDQLRERVANAIRREQGAGSHGGAQGGSPGGSRGE